MKTLDDTIRDDLCRLMLECEEDCLTPTMIIEVNGSKCSGMIDAIDALRTHLGGRLKVMDEERDCIIEIEVGVSRNEKPLDIQLDTL